MYIEITPDDYRVQFRYQSDPDYGSEIIPFAKLKQDLVITLADDVADKTFADIAFAIAHDVAVIVNDTERKVYARLSAYDDGNSYTFDALLDDGRGVWTVTDEDAWSYELIPIGGGGGSSDHRDLEHRDAADQHPISAITGLQDALDGKQPSGDYALTEELDALADVVESIEGKIPEQASAANQLADKAFVNSSIATNTAYFRGTYDVVDDLHLTFDATEAQVAAALASVITEVTNNDYAFVVFVDTIAEIPTRYDRYKYGTQDNEWQYEYTLNNSSFTSSQWDAISSGITSGLVAKLNALPDAESLAAALLAKYEKPSSGIPESDLSVGVQTKLNEQEVFVATYGETTFAEIVAAYMAGKIVVGKASNGAYAVLSLINALYQVSFSYVLDGKVYQFGIGIVGDWSERDVISLSDTISAQSTDNEFPTAKATYDYVTTQIGNIETLLAAI